MSCSYGTGARRVTEITHVVLQFCRERGDADTSSNREDHVLAVTCSRSAGMIVSP